MCSPELTGHHHEKRRKKKKTEKGETIKNNNNGIFKSRIERLVCDWIAKSTPPPHQIKNSSTRRKRIVRGGEADVYLTHLLLAMYSGLPTKRIKNTLPRGSRKQCCTKWRGEKNAPFFPFPSRYATTITVGTNARRWNQLKKWLRKMGRKHMCPLSRKIKWNDEIKEKRSLDGLHRQEADRVLSWDIFGQCVS